MKIRTSRILKKVAKYGSIAVLCAGTGFYIGRFTSAFTLPESTITPLQSTLPKDMKQEKVMVIGGSAAHGWTDPNNNSYIRRAFQSLTDTTNTQYVYIDKTTIGGESAKLSSTTYSSWLQKDSPQVVVISWGLLDDVSNHTPLSTFEKTVRDEVSLALKAKVVVVFVSPEIVEATVDNKAFTDYLKAEYSTAQSFHSRNVYWCNLYDDSLVYIQAHGQSLADYAGGTWHPNEAGHELGGELLYNELIQQFGSNPISFNPPGNKATKKTGAVSGAIH